MGVVTVKHFLLTKPRYALNNGLHVRAGCVSVATAIGYRHGQREIRATPPIYLKELVLFGKTFHDAHSAVGWGEMIQVSSANAGNHRSYVVDPRC
jgi:hypothetical protein